jgi:hypothetical protein
MMNVRRHFAICLAIGLASPTASAADTTDDRRALMIAGQVLRNNGRLLQARETLDACVSGTCADATPECTDISVYCKAKGDELRAEIPSISIRVEDERGVELHDAFVRVGAEAVDPTKLVELDPGKYVVRVNYAGRVGTAEVALKRAEKGVPVRVMIDLRREISVRQTRWYTYVLGTTTGIAALSVVAFGIAAQVQANNLAACYDTCPPSHEGLFLGTTIAADVSLAVAGVAALATVFSYLLRPSVNRMVHDDRIGGDR